MNVFCAQSPFNPYVRTIAEWEYVVVVRILRDLPPLAPVRIHEHCKPISGRNIIVIGDTPNDIECARHFGARALADGTGRLYTAEA